MEPASLLSHLRRELDAFRACLSRDLSARVEHCGDWTVHDLAEHVGGSNLWAAAAVTEGHGNLQHPPAPREPSALARWFDDAAATLLNTLDADASLPAWSFHPPHTVGFWQRRRCLEALVHRWDAENALGEPDPLDADLAGEGVAEVLDTMAPRQVARGRALPPPVALRLEATDTGVRWTYGPDAPVAILAGTAEDLLLLLWGRKAVNEEAFTWKGDQQAGERLMSGPLVP